MSTPSVQDAIQRAQALHKAKATTANRREADLLIPFLASEVEEEDELRVLAERWIADPSALGRRARDLAVELARRVISARGLKLD